MLHTVIKQTKRSATFAQLTSISTLFVSASFVPIVAFTGTAHADVNCSSPNSSDSDWVSGSSWLSGGGVNACSADEGSVNVCVPVSGAPASSYCSAGNVWSGTQWQCVEFINRLYLTKGWTTTTWYGDAYALINDVHNHPGLSTQYDGSISYLNPGDVVTATNSGAGHAWAINTVGSTIDLVSQNTDNQTDAHTSAHIASGTSLSAGNADIDFTGWAGYEGQAVIHHPQSGLSDLRQFYVSNGSWVAFDISSATGVNIAGNPAVSSSAELARDANGHFRQFYVSNGSWTAFDISAATGVNIAGNPVVDSTGGLWARGTNNHLYQFYVSNGSWTSFDVSAATGYSMYGDPAIGNGGDWIKDTNGHLRELYVSNGSWTSFDVSNATGVTIYGNPVLSSGGEWAWDTSNQLRQFYVSNGSWVAFNVSNATGVNINANPAIGSVIWVQDSGQHLRELYVSNGSWTNYDVSNATGVNVAGNPVLDASGNTWERDTSNSLQQFYQSNGTWTHANVSGAAGGVTISSDPAIGSGGEYAAS